MMKYLPKLIALALLAVPLTACSLSGDAIDGQVLEEGTNKPVAGAIVVVRWTGNDSSGLVDGHGVCYHVETATSDAAGKFHINKWSDGASMHDLFVSNRAVYKEAYKAGYTRPNVPGNKLETVFVKPFTGTKDEYFNYLDRLTGSNACSSGGESRKNLYRLYNSVYEETKSIADTPNQKKKAEWMLRSIGELLINETKPTKYDEHGNFINVNPKDSYKKEDLLK